MGSAWVMEHDRDYIPAQQISKDRLALTPGLRYSSVRHDLRTSGHRASLFVVGLSYLQLRSELHQMAAAQYVHSSRGSITSMAKLCTANGGDESRLRG